jgi:hypothetical protein
MNAAGETAHARHCHHCHRIVHDTVHTRLDYRVGFYSLHTGDTEPASLFNPKDGSTMVVRRLIRPCEYFTCVDCYRLPAVLEERERLFRPEAFAAPEA